MGTKALTRLMLAGIGLCLLFSLCLPTVYAQPPIDESRPAQTATRNISSLMEVAPANPLLVLQMKGAAEALARIEDTRAWQQLINAPMWEILWAYFEVETQTKDMHRLVRPGMSIVSHLLGQELLFVIPKFRGIMAISPTLLVQLDRSDDLGELLATGVEVGLANIPDTTSRAYSGYNYYLSPPLEGGLRVAVGLIDNLLVASLGEETLKKSIDLYQGKSTESLANDTSFSQVMGHFQQNVNKVTDYQSSLYIDVEPILGLAEQMYPMFRGQVPQEFSELADRAVKWLDLVKSISVVSNVQDDGVVAQSYVKFNPEATAENFLAMLQAPPTAHNSIQFVSADSGSYGATNLVNLPKLWEMAMNTIESLPEEMRQKVLDGLDTIQTQFNLNIENDLFSWMGNEVAVISTGEYTIMPTGNAGKGNLEALPQFLFSIQTIDRSKAIASLERLANLATMTLAAMQNLQLDWQATDYFGTQIHEVEIPNLTIQPGYAVTDDHVLFAMNSSDLRKALDCAAGRSEGLSKTTAFQELRRLAPTLVNSIGYANVTRTLEGMLQSLTEQLPSVLEDEFSGQEAERLQLIQPIISQSIDFAKVLAQTLVGQVQYTVKEDGGLRGYSHLKMQDIKADDVLEVSPEAQFAQTLLIGLAYAESQSPSRAHPYLDSILEGDPDHPKALLAKINVLEHEGNEKRADWFRRKLGFAPEKAWHIIGPFPNPDSEGFETPYPPEMALELGATYETEMGEVAWEKREDDVKGDGFINFYEMFEETDWQVAYAWTTVTAEEAGEVELKVGSDDDIKVWVNGNDVLTNQIGRVAQPDQDRVHVSLNPGKNQILVKVCNREGDWGFYLRFTDENHRAIRGLTYGQ